jgi:hypothetical protein
MLRQLGNSFIVQPNVLRSYLTEGHLGRIEMRLLKPYLQQRSDYASFAKSMNLDDAPGEEKRSSAAGAGVLQQSAAATAAGGGNRLSAISGVAGAGMGKLRGLLRELEGLGEEDRDRGNAPAQGQGQAPKGPAQHQAQIERDRARAAAPSHYMFVGMH